MSFIYQCTLTYVNFSSSLHILLSHFIYIEINATSKKVRINLNKFSHFHLDKRNVSNHSYYSSSLIININSSKNILRNDTLKCVNN